MNSVCSRTHFLPDTSQNKVQPHCNQIIVGSVMDHFYRSPRRFSKPSGVQIPSAYLTEATKIGGYFVPTEVGKLLHIFRVMGVNHTLQLITSTTTRFTHIYNSGYILTTMIVTHHPPRMLCIDMITNDLKRPCSSHCFVLISTMVCLCYLIISF